MPLARVFGIVEDHAPLGPAQNVLLQVPDHVRVGVQDLPGCRWMLLLFRHLAEQVVAMELPDLSTALETSFQRHTVGQIVERVFVRLRIVAQLDRPGAARLTGG